MKTIIPVESDYDDIDSITITDEATDNTNYVEIVIGNTVFDVLVDELYAAAKMFYETRLRQLKEDNIKMRQNE